MGKPFPNGVQEEVPGSADSASDGDDLRIKDGHEAYKSYADLFDVAFPDGEDRRVVSLDGVHDLFGVFVAFRPANQCGGGGVALIAASFPTGAGFAAGVGDHVAELRARTADLPVGAAVQNGSAADTGADGQVKGVLLAF